MARNRRKNRKMDSGNQPISFMPETLQLPRQAPVGDVGSAGQPSSPPIPAARPQSSATATPSNTLGLPSPAMPGATKPAASGIPSMPTQAPWGPTSFRPNNPRRDTAINSYADKQMGQQTATPSQIAPRPDMTQGDQQQLDQRQGPLGDLPIGLQNEVKERALRDQILGDQTPEDFEADTAAIKAKAARLKAENEAMAAESKRQNANMDANARVGNEGQANYSDFGSLQDAQRFAAPNGQIGLNTGRPGSVNYAGLLTPEQQSMMSTDRAVSLGGRSIMPDMPLDPLVAASRGTGPTAQAAEMALGAQDAQQAATLERIQNDPSIDPPNMQKAAQQQAERKAIGAQRRADSLEARKNNTTPEIEASRREIESRVAQAKSAEIEAARVRTKQEAIGQQIDQAREQMGYASKSIGDISRAIKDGGMSGSDGIVALREARNEYNALKQTLGDLNMRKQVAGISPQDIDMLKGSKDDPAAMELFDSIYGAGSAAYLLRSGKK